jgi:hypothetical protein
MIKNKIKKIVKWLASFFGNEVGYQVEIYEDLPDNFEQNTLYLIGENNNFWQAAMLCPCNCGDLIQLTLGTKGKPRWQVNLNNKKQPTVKPSVHRKVNCKSHFFLKDGKVIWCDMELID